MPTSTTLEPPVEAKIEEQQKGNKKTATGKGGRTHRRGGGGLGTDADEGGYGNPTGDDIRRLIKMLTLMRESLELIVNHDPPLVPRDLLSDFRRNWPHVYRLFGLAIHGLRRGNTALKRKLRQAGLSGAMLTMKQRSLNFYLQPLNEAIKSFAQTGKHELVITAPLSSQRSWLDFVDGIKKFFRPGSLTMNSVLESLAGAIPLVEGIKEFKDHLEAANAYAEANRKSMD
jgi:hypothetical protein